MLGDRVYVGTLDAHLVALNAKTGRVEWDVAVADYSKGYSITGAPLAVDDMVLTGVGGGEFGIRGIVDAYDAATGRGAGVSTPSPQQASPAARHGKMIR